MYLNTVINKIFWYLKILASVALLVGAIALAVEAVPLLIIFLSRYFSEVKIGQWMVTGGLTLAVLTLIYIMVKKN